MINVTGRLVFHDLVEPGGAPGFKPGYSVTFQVDKRSPDMRLLLEEMQAVAIDTWGGDLAQQNLAAIQLAIENGVEPRFAPSPIQDGDLNAPEYNGGTFVMKAARRLDQGPPKLFGLDGLPITDVRDAPKQGDGVVVAVNVWAMKKHNRINFTVEGVRVAIVGARVSGPPPAVIEEGLRSLASLKLPSQIAGVEPALGIEAHARPMGVPEPAAAGQTFAQVPAQEIVAPEAPQGASSLFRPAVPEPEKGDPYEAGDEAEEVAAVVASGGPTMFNL